MMKEFPKHLLITGRPGVGKTTLIKRLIPALPPAGGFYTEEIDSAENEWALRLLLWPEKKEF